MANKNKRQKFEALDLTVDISEGYSFCDGGLVQDIGTEIRKVARGFGLDVNQHLLNYNSSSGGACKVFSELNPICIYIWYKDDSIVTRAHEEAHAIQVMFGDAPLDFEAQRVFGLRDLPSLGGDGPEWFAHRGSILALVKRGYSLNQAVVEMEKSYGESSYYPLIIRPFLKK